MFQPSATIGMPSASLSRSRVGELPVLERLGLLLPINHHVLGDIRMKKAILILNFVMLLVSAHVYANDLPLYKPFSLVTTLGFGNTFGLPLSNAMSVKLENGFNEAKDPAVRKGTENWEETQTSFFIVPAVAIGIIALFLIFNRNKD
jgi:hypothetical protein